MDERGRADRVHESGTLNEMPQSWETEARNEKGKERYGVQSSAGNEWLGGVEVGTEEGSDGGP